MSTAPDSFLYFAYGSNMSLQRLRAADRAPSAQWLAAASVAGHRLVFDKVGMDGSGKADCERSGRPDDVVHGGLFRVSEHDRPTLDRAEGLGKGYDAVHVDVTTAAGVVSALTYLATRKAPHMTPYGWYLEHVLHGARQCGLPPGYIAGIERIASMPDPDAARDARERSIYAPLSGTGSAVNSLPAAAAASTPATAAPHPSAPPAAATPG